MDIKNIILEDFGRAIAFIVLFAIIFLMAKFLKDFLVPYKLNDELAKNDNFAVALTMSGYYFATAIIFVGALLGPNQDIVQDLISVGIYSSLGLALLNISRWFNDKIILSKFCDIEQIVKKRNYGVASVHFGVYIATGLIAAGAIYGQGGGLISALAFFVLGQISLFLFSYIYGFLTPYNIHEQLEQNNTAAGIAFGGTLIALGIIILNGSSGDFVSWQEDFTLFFVVNIMAFIFLPIIRLIMDRLVIPNNKLSKEINEDKNLGAGLLEATIAIIFATILAILI